MTTLTLEAMMTFELPAGRVLITQASALDGDRRADHLGRLAARRHQPGDYGGP